MGRQVFSIFSINHGVAQGCTLSPTLFLIYINGLLNEIEKCPELGTKFSKNKMSGLLIADDFVGITETGPALQNLIDIVHNFSICWRFEANVKSVIVIFQKQEEVLASGFGVMKAFQF